MNATDALDDTLEQARHQVLDLVNFAYLEDLLELGQEKSFLNAVGERPVSQEAFKEGNSKGAILSQE